MSLRGFRAPVAVALSSVLMITVGPAPAGTAAPAAARAGSPVELGTYNIRAGVSTGTFEAAVRAVRTRADLVGLQEVNSKAKEDVLKRMSGWAYYRPARYRGEQNPVIWKTSQFTRISARSARTAPSCYIGNERRGPNRIKPHYATIVRLRHRATGERIVIVNAHLVPGAVKGGRPAKGKKRSFRCYARELRNLRAVAHSERRNGTVFAMGDFNAGFVPDRKHRKRKLPFRRFRSVDMRSMWATERPNGDRGTRNDALIDQIWARERAANAWVEFGINYSDHRPGIARYRLG